MAKSHQILPRIRHGGHTGICDQRAALAGQHPRHNLLSPLSAVMFKIAHHWLFDAKMVEQLQRHPGVLSGYKISLLQRLDRAGGKSPKLPIGVPTRYKIPLNCLPPCPAHKLRAFQMNICRVLLLRRTTAQQKGLAFRPCALLIKKPGRTGEPLRHKAKPLWLKPLRAHFTHHIA